MQNKFQQEENLGGSSNKKTKNRDIHSSLCKFTVKGDWSKAESILKKDKNLVTKAISSDFSTMLHIAVGIGHNEFVKKLLTYINDEQVLQKRDSDGSTALHIAAIVGNKHAAELLVKKNKKLLRITDQNGDEPLHKAYENMHLDTIGYLLKAVKDSGKPTQSSSDVSVGHPNDEIGVRLLVNAISAKQYTLENIVERIGLAAKCTAFLMGFPAYFAYSLFQEEDMDTTQKGIMFVLSLLIGPIPMLMSAFAFICLLILIVCFVLLFLYFICWKCTKILLPPIKHMENKKKEWDEAIELLELICDEIDNLDYSGTHHPYYTGPILEAACQNAYKVVDEILFRSPEAIQSKDKNGYDIIQLAIINRSEKIYNLIYDIGERKNIYRTYKDSSQNNILHLAGKLAPSGVLNQRTGAALQLQRELQWREEVKKLVFPTYITRENIFKETPDMVFTKEHENLVKEGERWMKTTAESCSITAALITTIVFAAAITVPGGSHQEKGTPLFRRKSAFIVFTISDAISLFASSTALLVFMSILTARFAEKDFLVSLPRRLFIGLFSLLLSATAMMVAFSATLFLVFCDEKLWMLAPICGLALIPIAFFVGLQFPLMVDLFRSTHLRIFGKERIGFLRRFNPDYIRLRFGK
ncbi:putative ankyrin repeat-containing domain, PGG domain, ankyrin repeat-containing domain superfamily [Helianthus annuus]|nr:putative ankyrin repeat-containing domain, PGG domain, ankyrin repeat-containing domain superfamily [Helianthus annuus]